ncbi:MAG TPA: pilin [Steroidobacteraceae bacterium]|nr:pilin [Steroidobacteraceae bacterium]
MAANPSQSEELYRHAVGEKKAGYYVPLFYRFDQPGGSRVSWNWPAFFVTFFWLLYRRMYGLAVGYLLLLPIVFAILLFAATAVLGAMAGGLLYWLLIVGVQLILIPMFANAVYHWHVRRRIAQLAVDAPSQEALVQRVIGQASTAGAAVVIGAVCVYGIAILGILAAIAIPAYQDYTIRSQVVEGLGLATPVKESVARAYETSGDWPADLAEAGVGEAPAGKYVSDIEVEDGTILIHFGNAAHGSIAGHTLSLHPAEVDDGPIEWDCGYAAGEDATQTDIAAKYLPTSCRGTPPRVERL